MAALASNAYTLHFVAMVRPFSFIAFLLAFATLSTGAAAGLREDMARCAQIPDDGVRLSCFDAIVVSSPQKAEAGVTDGERRELLAALEREFRFSPQMRTSDFGFRLTASGELKISRNTAVARDVERLVRRIDKALDGQAGWGIAVTVHGGSVNLSRGTPYTGEELAAQARAGLARTDLPNERSTVEVGTTAKPHLWDDGRIRDANEHLDVVITGID